MAFKVRNPQNFWSGVLFIAVGLGYAYMARSYALGTVIEMGAGFFPFYLGMMMTCLGTVLVLVSLKTTGEAVGRFHWKPILWVIGSIVVFGFLLDVLGVVVAGLLLVVGVSLGGNQFRWKHALLLAVVLVAFSVLVFGLGLKLPIPLCPDFDWFRPFPFCRRL